jgi:hypothetical protein
MKAIATLMHRDPALAIAGAALTFLLLSQSRVPAMLVVLVYGGVAALLTDTTLVTDHPGDKGSTCPQLQGLDPGPPLPRRA